MKVTGAKGPQEAVQKQFGLINLLKAGAAQLIVLHHLAFYGPMADHARPLAPDLFDWLAGDARIAVQVFLVIGGFLAAKSLSPQGYPGLHNPVATILRRYIKLAPPFFIAMLLTVAASVLASGWMSHDSISAPPTLSQLGAHALLLHGVLGYESLSAGAWYVAIDFQLYAVTVLISSLLGVLINGCSSRRLMPIAIAAAVCASLLYFNRDSDWDVWAPYFMGSYGLGMLAWWASDPKRSFSSVVTLLLLMAVPTLLALVVDFRTRIALALTVACALVLYGRVGSSAATFGLWRAVNVVGKISYSVFLVHFPVCLIINAAFTRFVPATAHLQATGTLVAWVASLLVGAAFFRWIEAPLGRTFIYPSSSAVSRRLGLKG